MHVLFICPHGAAKSVIATAMLRDRAGRAGLDVTASNAGTEPDEDVNPIAVETLRSRHLSYDERPRLVTDHDIEAADLVVSFGCGVDDLPMQPQRLVDWSDAPDVSTDVDGFVRLVAGRLESLLG